MNNAHRKKCGHTGTKMRESLKDTAGRAMCPPVSLLEKSRLPPLSAFTCALCLRQGFRGLIPTPPMQQRRVKNRALLDNFPAFFLLCNKTRQIVEKINVLKINGL